MRCRPLPCVWDLQRFLWLNPLINHKIGAIVYRLGHIPFTDESWVRFPVALLKYNGPVA